MKLRLLSDLHLEFTPFVIPRLEGDEDTVLILAGDVGKASKPETYVTFLEDACKQFKAVIYIPGNHEYYGSTFPDAWDVMKSHLWPLPGRTTGEPYDENLYMLNNQQITIDKVRFVCSTMWTDMNKGDEETMLAAKYGMSDYHVIKGFTPEIAMNEHEKAKAFIFDNIYGPTVVVTHHGPTWQSIHPKYVGDILNGAYVSDLSQQIKDNGPQLWVHGHIHHSVDYTVGNTRVVTNPRGYTGTYFDIGPENKEFLPEFLLEV